MHAPLSTQKKLCNLREWLRLIFLPVLLLMPHSANACITFAEFEMEDIRKADLLFSGSVLRYEIVSSRRPGEFKEYGLITVRVRETLKGDIGGDVQLYWGNSTFGMPEELRLTDPALFAAVAPGKNTLPLRGGSATIFPSRRPDHLQVLQAPCAGAFMLPYARGSAENVRKILAGGSVDYFDNFDPDVNVIFRTTPASHRTERAFSIAMVSGAIVLVSLMVSAFWIWLRRRRRASAVPKS
jgi:hypothetical protein